jgi:hypothetical protein
VQDGLDRIGARAISALSLDEMLKQQKLGDGENPVFKHILDCRHVVTGRVPHHKLVPR